MCAVLPKSVAIGGGVGLGDEELDILEWFKIQGWGINKRSLEENPGATCSRGNAERQTIMQESG
jgi:hypothetical protein